MNIPFIFAIVWTAFISISFWESSVEGRNAWGKKKLGWELKIKKNVFLTRYHFYLFFITIPLLTLLPIFIYGWDSRLFGILVSAYFSGIMIEDFMWYVVNPVVKLKEFYTKFSDYYPWIRIRNKKIDFGNFVNRIDISKR